MSTLWDQITVKLGGKFVVLNEHRKLKNIENSWAKHITENIFKKWLSKFYMSIEKTNNSY